MDIDRLPPTTLADYRLRVLRVPQREIARRVKKKQGAVSTLEAGKLPRPWNWDVWMAAYEIREPDTFRFLVEGAARAKSLAVPMAETEPLFAGMQAQATEAVREPEERGALV
jgi:hypothetical protein